MFYDDDDDDESILLIIEFSDQLDKQRIPINYFFRNDPVEVSAFATNPTANMALRYFNVGGVFKSCDA